MDTFNWMVMELMAKEAQLERLNGNRKDEAMAPKQRTSVMRLAKSEKTPDEIRS